MDLSTPISAGQRLLNTYGDVYASGHAVVHLGDNHFAKDIAPEAKCHQALKTSPYVSQKDVPNPRRTPGTCQWALQHQHFQNWRQNDRDDLLWISADPGCGKSVFSRSLVDDLREEGNISVCYFFFRDNGQQDDLCTALCAVLHQLFTQQPQLICHAMPTWAVNGVRITTETDAMWQILQDSTASSQHETICVFDALDECNNTDRRRLIRLLSAFRLSAQTVKRNHPLKFLVTSRPYDCVQRWFNQVESEIPHIRLRGEDHNDQINQEIDLVIYQQVQNIAIEFDLPQNTQRHLIECLKRMQHRTYLWLHLAMDSVRNKFRHSLQPNKVTVKDLVLPRDVAEAYNQMLQKTDESLTAVVRQILSAVVGARRPLSSEEMYIILAVEKTRMCDRLDVTDFNKDRFEAQLRDWCGLFIFFNHSRLFLVHQTAKEFLLAESTPSGTPALSWRCCLSNSEVEKKMVRACVGFMCLEAHNGAYRKRLSRVHRRKFVSSPLSGASSQSRGRGPEPGLVTFWDYSISFWISHVDNSDIIDDLEICQRIYKACHSQGVLTSDWARIALQNQFSENFGWAGVTAFIDGLSGYEPTHLMAMSGQTKALKCLCRGGPITIDRLWVEAGRTPLHWAICGGHIETVRCLLELGADVEVFEDLALAREVAKEQVGDRSILSRVKFPSLSSVPQNALDLANMMENQEIFNLLLRSTGKEENGGERVSTEVVTLRSSCGRSLQRLSFQGQRSHVSRSPVKLVPSDLLQDEHAHPSLQYSDPITSKSASSSDDDLPDQPLVAPRMSTAIQAHPKTKRARRWCCPFIWHPLCGRGLRSTWNPWIGASLVPSTSLHQERYSDDFAVYQRTYR